MAATTIKPMTKIILIGDVHTLFNDEDVAFFNQSDADLILFVGDLANHREKEGIQTAKIIARLTKPTLLIPGNHDTVTAVQTLAEIKWSQSKRELLGKGQPKRVQRFHEALGDVTVGGYSTHSFQFESDKFDIVVGRPYSLGGPKLNFIPQLKRQFNVAKMEDSVAKLKECIDKTESDTLLFLAHNGPTGLGHKRDDIWGCDFFAEEGDFGDPDLAEAIQYAKSTKKQVLGVFAGHMHQKLKGGGLRNMTVKTEGTTYLNAGYVPRIFKKDGRIHHQYMQITLNNNELHYENCTFTP